MDTGGSSYIQQGGDGGTLAEFATRLCGSDDLFASRGPHATVNFVTAHDGFTLADLVSFNEKHNEANGENNRDGNDTNYSWNHGVEGPTEDVDIAAARLRSIRALLGTLLLSTGTPMLLMGDEMGRSQLGNNNAYNQDNETSWLDWSLSPEAASLLRWTTSLLNIRRAHPALRQVEFFDGRPVGDGRPQDLAWLRPDGTAMTDADWNDPTCDVVVMFLSGELFSRGDPAQNQRDAAFLITFNRGESESWLTLPQTPYGARYRRLLDTAAHEPASAPFTDPSGSQVSLEPRSVALFRVEWD